MHPRALLARSLVVRAAAPLLVATALAVAGPTAPAQADPVTGFQMPFPCGQSWTGTTRSSHSPSSRSIDWNRPDDLGDPVVAAAPGVVKTADTVDNSGYGRWVWISHTNDETSIYAHLKQVVVRQGQTVDQGTLIGYLGSSGRSTGPHLHFEQRRGSSVTFPFFNRIRFVFGSTLASRNCVDVPLAANMIGDAKAELVVFRRETRGKFLIHRPGKAPQVRYLGTGTDQPVLGDWDGDGRANLGVRNPKSGVFTLATPAGQRRVRLGAAGDLPIAGDFDGDGVTDIGVRRAAKNVFVLKMSRSGKTRYIPFGNVKHLPVTGDWNGDGVTDFGTFDTARARFSLRIVDSDNLVWTAAVRFGKPGDLPVTGDWDANGRTDVGTWNPATATFTQRRARSATSPQRRAVAIRFGRVRR